MVDLTQSRLFKRALMECTAADLACVAATEAYNRQLSQPHNSLVLTHLQNEVTRTQALQQLAGVNYREAVSSVIPRTLLDQRTLAADDYNYSLKVVASVEQKIYQFLVNTFGE